MTNLRCGKTLAGKVTDQQTGEGLPGVTIAVRGATPDIARAQASSGTGFIRFGLYVSVSNNRLSLTFDLYKTVTSDILLRRTLPPFPGVADVWQNMATQFYHMQARACCAVFYTHADRCGTLNFFLRSARYPLLAMTNSQ